MGVLELVCINFRKSVVKYLGILGELDVKLQEKLVMLGNLYYGNGKCCKFRFFGFRGELDDQYIIDYNNYY